MNEKDELKEIDDFFEQTERIKKLNPLIKSETTGTLKEIAEKLKVSESVIEDDIEYMNSYGSEIIYRKDIKSFSYSMPGEFYFGNFTEDEKELTKKTDIPL